jgi:hypothetical protein
MKRLLRPHNQQAYVLPQPLLVVLALSSGVAFMAGLSGAGGTVAASTGGWGD